MATKLIQKHLVKGTREFEIDGDQVNVRIKTPLKEEKFSVELNLLNPDPVLTNSTLEFVGRVRCGSLLSLFLDKPNKQEFDAFVEQLKQRAQQEFNAFAGLKSAAGQQANASGDKLAADQATAITIDRNRLDDAIKQLQNQLDKDSIADLLTALQALGESPDTQNLAEVTRAFNNLGMQQGAVLTYAPYISMMIAENT